MSAYIFTLSCYAFCTVYIWKGFAAEYRCHRLELQRRPPQALEGLLSVARWEVVLDFFGARIAIVYAVQQIGQRHAHSTNLLYSSTQDT